jgi:Flp pilus assembly protein protease CpaA
MTPAEITAIILALIASITDVRTKKVPNWLTFPGALIGLFWQWQSYKLVGIILGVLGWLLAIALMLGPKILLMFIRRYKTAPIGFGDIKLLAAIGSCLGPNRIFCVFFFFCVFFGCFSLWKIGTAMPWSKLRSFTTTGVSTMSNLTPEERLRLTATLQTSIPIAPIIALSTICSIYLYLPLVEFMKLVF